MDVKLTKEAWPIDVSPSSQAWFSDKLNQALDEIEQLQAENKKLRETLELIIIESGKVDKNNWPTQQQICQAMAWQALKGG